MTESKLKELEAKAWCFDHDVSKNRVVNAWKNAIDHDVFVVKNFDSNGRKWYELPIHLLEQLVNRYGEKEGD